MSIRGSQDRCPELARPWNHPPKPLPKRIQNASKFSLFFDVVFFALGSIFPPNLVPKTHQNPSKIDAKRPSILAFIFYLVFHSIFFDFAALRTVKIIVFRGKNNVFSKNGLSKLASIFLRFVANLHPFSLTKSIQIACKIDLESHRFLHRIFYRFLKDLASILGPKLGPCWLLFRHETAPKTLPRAQDTKNTPRTPPGSLWTSILVRSILEPRGIDFSVIFQSIFR